MGDKNSILVVDDDESICENLRKILISKGYDVSVAYNGNEAIKKSKKKYFNLALLDIKLPDMEGTDLLIELVKLSPKTMKIMITGFASIDNVVKSLNRGADGYLMKPVKTEELLRIIDEKLSEQKAAVGMTKEKIASWIEDRLKKIQ